MGVSDILLFIVLNRSNRLDDAYNVWIIINFDKKMLPCHLEHSQNLKLISPTC